MEKKEDCNNVVIRNALVTESDIPQQKEADIGDISLQLPTKQDNSRMFKEHYQLYLHFIEFQIITILGISLINKYKYNNIISGYRTITVL